MRLYCSNGYSSQYREVDSAARSVSVSVNSWDVDSVEDVETDWVVEEDGLDESEEDCEIELEVD